MLDDYFDAVPDADGEMIIDKPTGKDDHTWALIECDEGIIADCDWRERFVNVIGYCVTEQPHTIGEISLSMIPSLEIFWTHESEFETETEASASCPITGDTYGDMT